MSAGPAHPLDDPVGLALRGVHSPYAVWSGTAVRYHPEVGPFAALGPDPGPEDWADLGRLLGPDGGAAVIAPPPLPDGWSALATYHALQMVGGDGPADRPTTTAAANGPDSPALSASREGNGRRAAAGLLEVVALRTEQDVADARDLVRRTEPGPFGPRTMELGAFLGVRDGGRLGAMAGERMRPPGWTEVSAVCTDPVARGRGLAATLVAAVTEGIRARGETPYLHVMQSNTSAVGVYRRLGFTVRREVDIVVVRPPRPRTQTTPPPFPPPPHPPPRGVRVRRPGCGGRARR